MVTVTLGERSYVIILGVLIGIILSVAWVMTTGADMTVTKFLICLGAGIFGGILGGVVSAAIRSAKSRAKQARYRHESERNDRERAIRETETRRRNAAQAAVSSAERAVTSFQRAPGHLENTSGWITEAQRCYNDGAFSPFWSAIENAYSCTAAYRTEIDTIQREAAMHATQITSYTDAGGDPHAIAEFPIQIDEQTAAQAVQAPLATLQNLTYQAQKHPVFAQIWEQRRTTAAVIAGFANLEQAVHGMTAAIQNSASQLETTLTQSRQQIASAIANLPQSIGDRISAGLPAPNADQEAQMRQLASTALTIKNEVFRMGHGRYPMM